MLAQKAASVLVRLITGRLYPPDLLDHRVRVLVHLQCPELRVPQMI